MSGAPGNDADKNPEIEITPAMIKAAIEFCENEALGTLSASLVEADFAQRLCRAVVRALPRKAQQSLLARHRPKRGYRRRSD